MRPLLISLVACLAAIGALRNITSPPSISLPDIQKYKLQNSVSCSPDAITLQHVLEDADIPPMPGSGKYVWKIQSRNDSAQFYFNQGINMYYGFHIIESLASFSKASKFDAGDPMVWWAQALALGPNINDVSYAMLPQAVEMVTRAKDLVQRATPLQKQLVAAMSLRYSSDTTASREKLNADYTNAMASIYAKYPDSADVAALYADAIMLQHPWDLWNVNGTPKPWTPLLRDLLEKALPKTPEHPGLNHYYVHVMEPSPYPEKALASANRLGLLSPGLSHIVHMPSHIYLRTGYYIKGYQVNEEALKQYNKYLALYPAAAGNEFLYRLHNEHMLINCAMHAGRKKYTIEKAVAFQQSIGAFLSAPGPMGNYLGYVYMVPTLTRIRFADWDGLLGAPPVDSTHIYASLLSHFGRGMAFANKNNIDAAEAESNTVTQLLRDTVLALPLTPFSPSIDGARVAHNLLLGTIALQKAQYATAIAYFKSAADQEKNMVYNEPRDWLLNPKYYLADAYLKARKWKLAEKGFNDDLNDNHENVWSLAGLYKTFLREKRTAEAAKVAARLKIAAAESDVNFMVD